MWRWPMLVVCLLMLCAPVAWARIQLNRTHFKAYGLGWRLADVHGYKEVAHTGTLAGMKSSVVLVPDPDRMWQWCN